MSSEMLNAMYRSAKLQGMEKEFIDIMIPPSDFQPDKIYDPKSDIKIEIVSVNKKRRRVKTATSILLVFLGVVLIKKLGGLFL